MGFLFPEFCVILSDVDPDNVTPFDVFVITYMHRDSGLNYIVKTAPNPAPKQEDVMKKIFSLFGKHTVFQKTAFIIFLLFFIGLEAAAIWFDGFSFANFAIMAGLCLLCLFIYFINVRFPWFITVPIVLISPAVSFYLMESLTHVVFDTMKSDAITLNLIFYYLLFLSLFFIFGRARLALYIQTVFVMIAGIANYFVILFRSTPILPWDLLSLGTAVSVADNYTFSIDHNFALMCGWFLVLLACISKTGRLKLSSIEKRLPHRLYGPIIRLVLLLLLAIPSGLYINLLFQPDLADNTSLDDTLFTPKYMYRTNGFFVAFLMDMRYLQVDEPSGYSVQTAKDLLAEQTDHSSADDTPAADELPNVIVIMNEAFSDPSVLGDFETNIDYMPNVSALLDGAENTVSGHLYSSVLGGNTANSEWEFLTGNSMAFLPNGSVPYQQYIHTDVSSVVDQFESLGYETYAMHPYNAGGWNRNQVYRLMHFDNMLFYNDFTDRVKLRKYVDDASDYANILRITESTDKPVFIFNVTMQNHSGYGDSYDNFTPEVTALLKNAKTNRYLDNYLSLIQISDQAIGDLLDTLRDSDRPTVVVFFGDHQPNDYVVKPVYLENGMDIDNQTLEQQQNRQIVPFFIWANYDIPEADGLSVSINYLSSILFDTIGLPMTSYQSFLLELYQKIPVINSVGFIDKEGNCLYLNDAQGDTKSLLDDYHILEYYNIFDNAQ